LRGQPRDEKAELDKFFKVISKFKLDDIISIDETSISTSLKFNYCRNYLGKRCIIKTDDNAVFTKYSLVVAINNKKCIGYKLYENGGEAGLHPSNVHDCEYAIGAINFTGDFPVILAKDGPSLGGFVCPVTIAKAELWKVGQLKADDKISFYPLTVEQANALEQQQIERIEN
jgi:hypothetical protein